MLKSIEVLDPHVYARLTWSLSPHATQLCNYARMQVCKYASMQVCTHASMQVCKYASMKIRLKENKDGQSLISIHFSRKWKEISESSDSTRCFPIAKVTVITNYKIWNHIVS